MRIALISPHYPPLRTSAAVQMRDLARELARQGHQPTVLVPGENLSAAWRFEDHEGVGVLWLAAPLTRDLGYVRRTFNEMRLSLSMWRSLRKSPLSGVRWDGVVWYSPPIFFGPLVWALKRSSRCETYLILRDIFPEWAIDLGLLSKGPAYWFFKAVAAFQYAVASTIGVQTESNRAFVPDWTIKRGQHVEVLRNWLAPMPNVGSSIVLCDTILAGRKIFAYVGNMGVAQGAGVFIDLAERLAARRDLGFLFVGRGTDVPRLKAEAASRAPTNTLFHNEVDPSEMPGLLAQCHAGLLSLDPRHSTHNIPGKFLTYLQAGLPVLARVNSGTDLAGLVERECVGFATVGGALEPLTMAAQTLADDLTLHAAMSANARALAETLFSSEAAVRQISSALHRTT